MDGFKVGVAVLISGRTILFLRDPEYFVVSSFSLSSIMMLFSSGSGFSNCEMVIDLTLLLLLLLEYSILLKNEFFLNSAIVKLS